MLASSCKQIKERSVRYGYEFWQFRSPLNQHKICPALPHALDNGCFSTFDEQAWSKMVLEAIVTDPIFVCLPDIVGDAVRTLDLFDAFKEKTSGVNRALVIQDGIGNHRIPWDDIEAIFVGGSNEFKKSDEAFNVCKVANMLGKWIHVGRINSMKRAWGWLEWADSCDGSGMTKYDERLESVLTVVQEMKPLHKLFSKKKGSKLNRRSKLRIK